MRKHFNKLLLGMFLTLTLCLYLLPNFAFASEITKSSQANAKEQHCYLLLSAAKPEDKAAKRESKRLKEECYNSAEEREQDNPLKKDQILAQGLLGSYIAPTSTSGDHVHLITLYSDPNRGGSSYQIDGYEGCGAYYSVASLAGFIDSQTSSSQSYCSRAQYVWTQTQLSGGQLYLFEDRYLSNYIDQNFDNLVRSWEHNR